MTREEALEVMRDLEIRAAIAQKQRDYKLRDDLCWLHDTVALAIINDQEIPTLPRFGGGGGNASCLFRKLAA